MSLVCQDIPAIVIYALVLLTAAGLFVRLIKKMRREQATDPPINHLFIILVVYAALLLTAATSLLGVWPTLVSVMASCLVLPVPFTMGIIAYLNYRNSHKSKYHGLACKSALWYFIAGPVAVVLHGLIKG